MVSSLGKALVKFFDRKHPPRGDPELDRSLRRRDIRRNDVYLGEGTSHDDYVQERAEKHRNQHDPSKEAGKSDDAEIAEVRVAADQNRSSGSKYKQQEGLNGGREADVELSDHDKASWDDIDDRFPVRAYSRPDNAPDQIDGQPWVHSDCRAARRCRCTEMAILLKRERMNDTDACDFNAWRTG